MIGQTCQVLPSVMEVRRLLKAFRAAAEKEELGHGKRRIYRAWIVGFLCWSIARPPHQASPDRVRPFLRAIRHHPDSEPSHEAQATGALDFLFGPVQKRLEGELSLFKTGVLRTRGLRSLGGRTRNRKATRKEKASSPPRASTKPKGSTPLETSKSEARHIHASQDKRGPPKKKPLEGQSSEGPLLKAVHPTLHLSLSEEQARRLSRLAGHLELPPELVVKRALDLVCKEAGTPLEEPPSKERPFSTGTLLYQNQARIDLFAANDSVTSSKEASAKKNLTEQATLEIPKDTAGKDLSRRLPGFGRSSASEPPSSESSTSEM